MDKLVFCMKWGTRYGPEYVNRLARAVRANVSGGVQIVCFTDDATGVGEGVECRPLPPFEGVPPQLANKPWRKLSLWQRSLGADLDGRDALVLDVDLVVVGNLDAFWDYEPGKYAVIENWSQPGSGIGNTSVFRFKVGAHPEIYERFVANPEQLYREEFRIEQSYISSRLGDGRAVRRGARNLMVAEMPFYKGLNEQVFWPKGWCLSFKRDLLPVWPLRWWVDVPRPGGETRIVVFHGKPDPDEAAAGVWPSGGLKWLYKRVRPVRWLRDLGW